MMLVPGATEYTYLFAPAPPLPILSPFAHLLQEHVASSSCDRVWLLQKRIGFCGPFREGHVFERA